MGQYILKQCYNCKRYYVSTLLNPRSYCSLPECEKKWEDQKSYFILQRYVQAHWFDVYSLKYQTNTDPSLMYWHICRVCGGHLLNSKGKYNHRKRYCDKHSFYSIAQKFDWNTVRKEYLKQLHEKQCKKDPSLKAEKNMVLCEQCNSKEYMREQCVYNPQTQQTTICMGVEVHHIKPIHQLTANNDEYLLVWDFKNLQALCVHCHNTTKKYKKVKSQLDAKFKQKRLTPFFNTYNRNIEGGKKQ